MVQTDLSQLSAECSDWRQILRSYKDELIVSKKSLQDICRKSITKDQLPFIEHFDNQFHIQLINIHDLKQAIKSHERILDHESSSGDFSENSYRLHEILLEQFIAEENTLQELRTEYQNFISRISC